MNGVVIVLLGLAALLALEVGIRLWRKRLRRDVRRLRRFDAEAEAFHEAARALLELDGLPDEALDTMLAFNEMMRRPETARQALCALAVASDRRAQVEADAGYRRYREELRRFFERSPEGRALFDAMTTHGLRALVLRAGPEKLQWLLGLLQRHLLREEEMALALARTARKDPALREALAA